MKMAAPMRSMCQFWRRKLFAKCHFVHLHDKTIAKVSCSTMQTNNNLYIDEDVNQMIEDGKFKPKAHPGKCISKRIKLPTKLIKSIEKLLETYPARDLETNAVKLFQQLWSRQKPMEADELSYRASIIRQNIMVKNSINTDQLSDLEREVTETKVRQKALNELKKTTYHWTPMTYSAYTTLVYLTARIALDYSTVYRILSEVKQVDPHFYPRSLYDSGSGLGTVTWAANAVWSKTIEEHVCVDPSPDMNTVARLLLQESSEEKQMCFPNVYFRQFAPSSRGNKYDLVVSAFTLNELPNQAERIKYILSLWRRTGSYLVLCELGTNAGFQLILEAREFILQLADENLSSKILPREQRDEVEGYVVAPCPHDGPCPRFAANDGTPCNFPINYMNFSENVRDKTSKSRFSYVVLKKGTRDPNATSWPRVIRESSIVSKRVHCRMCTASGELQHSVVTAKKHGKNLYQVCRNTPWGDRLPVKFMDPEVTENITDNKTLDEDKYYPTVDADKYGSENK